MDSGLEETCKEDDFGQKAEEAAGLTAADDKEQDDFWKAERSWRSREDEDALTVPEDAQRIQVNNESFKNMKLMVAWKDRQVWFMVNELRKNKSRVFEATRIRDNCSCHECRDATSGNKLFTTAEIAPDVAVLNVEEDLRLGLRVTLGSASGGEATQHQTMLVWSEVSDLVAPQRQRRVQDTANMEAARRRFMPFFWKRNSVEKEMKTVPWQELQSPKGVWMVLEQLTRLGLVVVKDVPQQADAVEQIARLLGPVRETFYGRTFELRAKENADNVAYTRRALPLHQDLLYLNPPPRLQLLHCYSDGGAPRVPTLFCDAERIGRLLCSLRPRFPVLDPLFVDPVPYQYKANAHYYCNEHPVIDIDWRDQAYRQLWWSPPFVAPRQISGYSLAPWILVARFISSLFAHKSNMFPLDLESGQCVIFDNWRLLHGRGPLLPPQQAPPAATERLFYGTYLAAEDFYSAVCNLVEIPSLSVKAKQYTSHISREPDLESIQGLVQQLQAKAEADPGIGLPRSPPTYHELAQMDRRRGRWRLNGAFSEKNLSAKPDL
ncbi:hypothetical protein CDD81_1721 [Ophiocordyceps australis]|uniref:TauD/TfdA-like domain-containing protein n=1 Tax=Ophiocordyceps australis TaxID=1399860 RepID=A0A2C5Y824_9HYPO|nr:hypothetical protein CDD81_1721 [Ophiocordyceps australis]